MGTRGGVGILLISGVSAEWPSSERLIYMGEDTLFVATYKIFSFDIRVECCHPGVCLA